MPNFGIHLGMPNYVQFRCVNLDMKSYFCIALALLALSVAQEISQKHSFVPPFNNYGWSGTVWK